MSIRELINANALANTVGILRSHPKNKKAPIILVEGSSDRIFLKNMCNPQTIIISCDGKVNALYTLEKVIERKIKNTLGIVDTDFDYYHQNPNYSSLSKKVKQQLKNILFYTDSHDLETMLIQSKAFFKLINQYGDESKITKLEKGPRTLLHTIISQSKIIGVLRLLSIEESWGLGFKFLNYEKFYNGIKMRINIEKLVDEIFDKSKKVNASQKIVLAELGRRLKNKIDPWLVSTGHDVMKILLQTLKEGYGLKYKMKKITAVYQIEDILVLSYEFEFFKETGLYQQLVHWEQENDCSIF